MQVKKAGLILMAAVIVLAVDAPSRGEGADCCSCKVTGAKTFANPMLPCKFDYPAGWVEVTGDDGGIVSGVVGPPPCETICSNGTPAMTLSIGTTHDSNADTMEGIWRQAMPVVGTARCGEGTVTFFSPPGAEETGLLGGVKFYVAIGGKKYGGAATFTCGEPGGWLGLRKLFVETFGDNPDSTFKGD